MKDQHDSPFLGVDTIKSDSHKLSEIREIINEYLQIDMCESGKTLRDNILGVLIDERH